MLYWNISRDQFEVARIIIRMLKHDGCTLTDYYFLFGPTHGNCIRMSDGFVRAMMTGKSWQQRVLRREVLRRQHHCHHRATCR